MFSFVVYIIGLTIFLNQYQCQVRRGQYEDDDQQHVQVKKINFNFKSSKSGRSSDCSNCVEKRFLKHYDAKGCTPVIKQGCDCPMRYECPSIVKELNSTVCTYSGRTYQIGTQIPVKNVCRLCYCRDTNYGRRPPKAKVDCSTSIECPEQVFGVRPPPGCYSVYEQDKCCAVRNECPGKGLEGKRNLKVCNYKGRQYNLGQNIYPDEDKCKTCICTDEWSDDNPLESRSCKVFDCDFELEDEIKRGCTPIYHEGTCCPIEYKCPTTSNYIPLDPGSSMQCVFEGRKYPIGAKLKTDNICVNCTCSVPPDFTCVHRSCPSPEGNCRIQKYDDSVCCQKYVCNVRT